MGVEAEVGYWGRRGGCRSGHLGTTGVDAGGAPGGCRGGRRSGHLGAAGVDAGLEAKAGTQGSQGAS